jgi:hypothetical protein
MASRSPFPTGWWASSSRMSSVLQPAFRLTLSDRALHRTARDSGPCYAGLARQIQPDGVVAILSEALGADLKPQRFHLRPKRISRRPGSGVRTTRAWATTRRS